LLAGQFRYQRSRRLGSTNEPLSELRCDASPRKLPAVRDLDTIDSELRLVAAVRGAVRAEGGPLPSAAPMDELLDERLAHRGRGRRVSGSQQRSGGPQTAWAQIVPGAGEHRKTQVVIYSCQ
jgi:hypothetical protein